MGGVWVEGDRALMYFTSKPGAKVKFELVHKKPLDASQVNQEILYKLLVRETSRKVKLQQIYVPW
jgi:hypothetical protein